MCPWKRWMLCSAKVSAFEPHSRRLFMMNCRGTRGAFRGRSFGAGLPPISAVQPIAPQPHSNPEPWAGKPPTRPQWAFKLSAHRGQRRIGTREDEQQCSRGRSSRRVASTSDACRPRGRERPRRLTEAIVCRARQDDRQVLNYLVVRVSSWPPLSILPHAV